MVQKLTDYLLANPLFAYGGNQMQEGAQATPVYSPWQGLARALQGGIGGLAQGLALRDAKGEMEADRSNLAAALQEPDSDKQLAMLAQRPGNADAIQSILLGKQSLSNQIKLATEQQKIKVGLGGQVADSVFGSAPPAGGGAPAGGTPASAAEFTQMMMPHAMAVSQATGLDPRLVIAQSALETGFGKAAPGNNYFGIKGPGQVLATQEAGPNGMYGTQDSFRTYPNAGASAQDYAQFLKGNSRYAPVLQAQGLDAQIDAMGKSGYATDPNYGAKLRQIAQNIQMPGAPVGAGAGLGVGPQQAANVPQPAAGGAPPGHVMYRGVPIPLAIMSLAEQAMRKGDVEGGFKILAEGAKSGAEYMRNGPELVDIRQADGSTIKVPRSQAANMVSARETPLAGSKEGDLLTLNDPSASPEAKQQAYARLSEPKQAMNGTLMYPDPRGFPTPPGMQAPAPGVRQEMTDESRFNTEKQLREEFQKNPVVDNYLKVKPLFEAMQLAKEQPGIASDTNLAMALGSIYAGGSGLPRGELLERISKAEGLTGEIKTALGNAINGRGMDPEVKQKLIDAAATRFGPLKAEYDARAQQYGQIAQRSRVKPENVLIAPSVASGAGGEKGGEKGRVRPFNPSTGRLE